MAELLVDAFLSGEIDAAGFRHAHHVEVAFGLLGRGSFLEAAASLSSGLKAITARAGHPGAYHETITLAFLALIAERRAALEGEDYQRFASANADLFDKTVLSRWYGPARLGSDLARRTFILPEPSRQGRATPSPG
jgi:hypothetical protein